LELRYPSPSTATWAFTTMCVGQTATGLLLSILKRPVMAVSRRIGRRVERSCRGALPSHDLPDGTRRTRPYDSLTQPRGGRRYSLALCTLTSAGFLTPGLVMRWRPVGRFVFVNGGIATAFPVLADLYSAWTMRTSCRPSSPDGSGWRFFRMQSEK